MPSLLLLLPLLASALVHADEMRDALRDTVLQALRGESEPPPPASSNCVAACNALFNETAPIGVHFDNDPSITPVYQTVYLLTQCLNGCALCATAQANRADPITSPTPPPPSKGKKSKKKKKSRGQPPSSSITSCFEACKDTVVDYHSFLNDLPDASLLPAGSLFFPDDQACIMGCVLGNCQEICTGSNSYYYKPSAQGCDVTPPEMVDLAESGGGSSNFNDDGSEDNGCCSSLASLCGPPRVDTSKQKNKHFLTEARAACMGQATYDSNTHTMLVVEASSTPDQLCSIWTLLKSSTPSQC